MKVLSKDQGQPNPLPRWTILSVTTLGAFMAAIDSNIVTIALPRISAALSSGVSLLGWVITGYVLAVAALVLQSGKLGDNYGKKNVYLIGFAIFGVASALCGISQDAYQLILFRVVQGAGASILAATAIPLIFASFPPSERGSAVGVNSIAWAIGAVAGPFLGGVLTAVDWRLIFYVNVPIAALAVFVGLRRIPSYLNARSEHGGRVNVVNSAILGIAIAAVMLWLSFFDVRLVPVAIVALAALVLVERSSKNPLLNRELLRNRGFVYSVLALGVMMTCFSGITFVMSFYFQLIAGFPPIVAGLWVAPLPITLAIFNPLAGRVFDRLRRPAATSILGGIEVLVVLILLSYAIGSPSPGPYVALLIGLLGVGAGFVWSPSISSALKFSRQELRGVANGTAFTLIYVAFAASIALVVAVSATVLPQALVQQIYLGSVNGLTSSQASLFEQGLSRALLGLAAVGAVGIPILFLVLREQTAHFQAYTEVVPAEGVRAPPEAQNRS